MTEHIPLVSIGLPVYNGERYLAEAIESLLAQDYKNIEIIISDNASTDTTPANLSTVSATGFTYSIFPK